MPKKLFAIVGYTDWGKSNTLYELFGRRQFYPMKPPIAHENFGRKRFTVVDASNEQRSAKTYIGRLENILKKQERVDTIYVVTLSLIFDGGVRDVREIFPFLNSIKGFTVHYLILENGWKEESSLKPYDIARMENKVRNSKMVFFSEAIDQSVESFSVRTRKIAEFILSRTTRKKREARR